MSITAVRPSTSNPILREMFPTAMTSCVGSWIEWSAMTSKRTQIERASADPIARMVVVAAARVVGPTTGRMKRPLIPAAVSGSRMMAQTAHSGIER